MSDHRDTQERSAAMDREDDSNVSHSSKQDEYHTTGDYGMDDLNSSGSFEHERSTDNDRDAELRSGGRTKTEQSIGSAFQGDDHGSGGNFDSAETRFGVDDPVRDTHFAATGDEQDSGLKPSSGFDFDDAQKDNSDGGVSLQSGSQLNTGYYSGSEQTSSANTDDSSGKKSTMGKVMEKAGGVLGSNKLSESGREKHETGGFERDESGY